MTKGLRCPNCDHTTHRKTVHDWLVNKTAPYLNCNNVFCNTRWKRAVLEANADQFSGEVKKEDKKPELKPVVKEVVLPKAFIAAVTVSTVKPVVPKKPVPKAFVSTVKTGHTKETWLDRVRTIARHRAKVNGVVAIDDLRKWADLHNDHPPYKSSWGSVFQPTEWKKVSLKRSSYTSSRSRKINVWALVKQTVAV